MIEFVGVGKKFGSLWANKNITFSVHLGDIHSVVGENGAGKSTIMKILNGLYQRDSGEIKIEGKTVNFQSPIEAHKHKVGMVQQHFALSPHHTALENLLLVNDVQNPFSLFFQKDRIQHIKKTAERFNFIIPWDKPVIELSVGIQQKIEILKLLILNQDILIFDEPTAVLTPSEIEELLQQILDLKRQGKTIILITHKLKEVLKVSDQVTILRKGEWIGTYPSQELTESKMAELMVGRPVHFNRRSINLKTFIKTPLLHFENVKSLNRNQNYDFDFKVHSGEVLGIAGIEGQGQEFIPKLIANYSDYKFSGQILGPNGLITRTKKNYTENSIGIFPEDRLKWGSLTNQTATQNFILGHHRHPEFQKNGFLNWSHIHRITNLTFKKFQISPHNIFQKFCQFSGGNQQKIVVARELYFEPKLIVASHPTRGVDVGAIEIIHETLIQFQEKGHGILLISSELDELLKLSDRILVVRSGKIVFEINRNNFDEKLIGSYMLGAV